MFQVSDAVDIADPVLVGKAAVGGCLAALSRPGIVVRIGARSAPIAPLHAATSELLLALLDQDTRLWLSPGAASDSTAASLKFHTGCFLAASPGEAEFAVVDAIEELPPLEAFGAGSPACPERSGTVLLQVAALGEGSRVGDRETLRLSGPGIRGERLLSVPYLGRAFLEDWERNRARYPRGVDLYLACGEWLCGLPRTTRIEA